MFEVAELGQSITKQEYNERLPDLRTALLAAQEALRENASFPVLVLVSGVDGSGKGETVNLLNEWFDPRFIRAHAFGEPSDEEAERPLFWRYWRALPPKGHIGTYISPWYSQPIGDRISGRTDDSGLDSALQRINTFEQELTDDGALIIKIWLHLSKSAQKKRQKKLRSNPDTAWRVTDQDVRHMENFDTFRSVAERALRITSTGACPWTIVEASNANYRDITVGQHIADRLQAHLQHLDRVPDSSVLHRPVLTPAASRTKSLLQTLDLSLNLPKPEYKLQLVKQQARLAKLARAAVKNKLSSILLFEGADAAGKGGAIRRIIPALDARRYQIIPVAAPTDEERAQHYLWRFWRHIPSAGTVTIYDRSWYGRVLVERVEGFASNAEWMRSYAEINDFEEQLAERGIILMKFWHHVSKEEQLARFKHCEETPFKLYKITEEDYRNRERWDEYEDAVNDMVERTSTEYAPWTLVESNDKPFARVKVITTFCDRLEAALDGEIITSTGKPKEKPKNSKKKKK